MVGTSAARRSRVCLAGYSGARWTAPAGVCGEELCYIVLMEVLDNLPHDKIQFSRPAQTEESGGIVPLQVVVGLDEETQANVELAEPLSDPLLCRALEIDSAHRQREVDDAERQVARYPDYTPGQASGEGLLGSLLVRR